MTVMRMIINNPRLNSRVYITLMLTLAVGALIALIIRGGEKSTSSSVDSISNLLSENEPSRRRIETTTNKQIVDVAAENSVVEANPFLLNELKNNPGQKVMGISNAGVSKPISNQEEVRPRPPLSSLVDEKKHAVIGDVQFLLDFAIVGHAKTGTSSQMKWLVNHDEVQMYNHEVHSLKNDQPDELVNLLYALPEGSNYFRGYKSPNDISNPYAMHAIRTYWKDTKLIVGVRHPVKWMESYYNFNTRQGNDLNPAEFYVGKHLSPKCKYHDHFAMLGKTNLTKTELDLLSSDVQKVIAQDGRPPKMTNKVFVYEVSQPFDSNRTRALQYSNDFSTFLGLQVPLQPIVPRDSGRNRNYHYAIDICDDKFQQLRSELVELGRNAAIWMIQYFLNHPDVYVSQRDQFEQLLTSWQNDPCKT